MGLLSWEDYCLNNRKTFSTVANAPSRNIMSEEAGGIGEPTPIQKLNEATEKDLTSIKGIGPKKAQMILENTPFDDFESLAALKGVSKKVCESIKSWTS